MEDTVFMGTCTRLGRQFLYLLFSVLSGLGPAIPFCSVLVVFSLVCQIWVATPSTDVAPEEL